MLPPFFFSRIFIAHIRGVAGCGIITTSTCSGPSASTAMANVSAESMPPESPNTAL